MDSRTASLFGLISSFRHHLTPRGDLWYCLTPIASRNAGLCISAGLLVRSRVPPVFRAFPWIWKVDDWHLCNRVRFAAYCLRRNAGLGFGMRLSPYHFEYLRA